VVDLKDIDMLSKLHANNGIVHEPPPWDELSRYSSDSDSDSDNDNENPDYENDDSS
jgi:hypothetical protein